MARMKLLRLDLVGRGMVKHQEYIEPLGFEPVRLCAAWEHALVMLPTINILGTQHWKIRVIG